VPTVCQADGSFEPPDTPVGLTYCCEDTAVNATTINVTTEANLPASIASATRLVGTTIPSSAGKKTLPSTVALCDPHATLRATGPIEMLPKAVEDEERYCAECVQLAGFTYAVELAYFKPTGKFYTNSYYFTKKQHLFEIRDEIVDMFSRGLNPGLTNDSAARNAFITYITVTGHSERYPMLIVPS